MRNSAWIVVLGIGALVGCGRKPAPQPGADTAGKMGGMQMAMQGMQMMPMMRTHLDSMAAMSPTQMAAMMAAHQQLASRMMDAMGADMRDLKLTPDSAWTALSDSLKSDLAELPGLTGAALKTRMEAHIGRMRRMMTMHQGMMKM